MHTAIESLYTRFIIALFVWACYMCFKLMIAMTMAVLSVSAKEPLVFSPPAPGAIVIPYPKGWKWDGAEPYKNEVLLKYQALLRDRGITNERHLKLLVAQLIQENGALTPDRIGDSGCSIGIPQRYTCQFGYSAKRFVEKYPEWKDLDFQLNWMADAMKANLDKHKDIKWAILSHNCPRCAFARQDNGYVAKVQGRTELLSL